MVRRSSEFRDIQSSESDTEPSLENMRDKLSPTAAAIPKAQISQVDSFSLPSNIRSLLKPEAPLSEDAGIMPMHDEEREALARSISDEDLGNLAKEVKSPGPSDADRTGNVGHVIREAIDTEAQYGAHLGAFIQLLEDPGLKLTWAGRNWVRQNLPKLKDAQALSQQMQKAFEGAMDKNGVPSAEKFLQVFLSPEFRNASSILGPIADDTEDWSRFADENGRSLRAVEEVLKKQNPKLSFSKFNYSPATLAFQRSPRYELLATELGKNLPDSYKPLLELAKLSVRKENLGVDSPKYRRQTIS